MTRNLLAATAVLLGVCGCGNETNNNVVDNGNIPVPPIGRIATYLVAGNFEGRALDVFRVDNSGALTPTGAPTRLASSVYSLTAQGPFIYTGANNQVTGFRIDNNGALTPLPGLPQSTVPDGTVAIDRDGDQLYAPGEDSIDGFAVDAGTGALTRLPNFPLPVPGMADAVETAFDLSGDFVHVSALGSRAIFNFAHNNQTGALTLVSQTATLAGPQGIKYDPSGRFLYVSEDNGTIQGFAREASGNLTPLAGFPVSFAPPGSFSPRFDFKDGTLFIGDRTSRTLNAFSVQSSGQLTSVPGYPVTNGGGEVASYPLPLNQFLYVGDRLGSRITGFSVGANSQVSPLPGSPFATTGGTTELLPVVVTF